jgi:hypothetical protein
MGCNAALLARRVIDNTFDVLAIQAMTLMQAIDYLKCQRSMSSFSRNFYSGFREMIPSFTDDHPRYKELKLARKFISSLNYHQLPHHGETCTGYGRIEGIGKAVCLKFAQLGYHVLINFKSNLQEAETTLKQITIMVEQANCFNSMFP